MVLIIIFYLLSWFDYWISYGGKLYGVLFRFKYWKIFDNMLMLFDRWENWDLTMRLNELV